MKILILDADWSQTAYLVAELNGLGAAILLASSQLPDPRGLGRYCTQIMCPHVKSLGYADFLRKILADLDVDCILPLSEDIMLMLWRLPSYLTEKVFPETTPRQRSLLDDRRLIYDFSRSVGIKTPESMAITDDESLDFAVDTLGLPCVIRGTHGTGGAQVRVVHSREQARSAHAEIKNSSGAGVFLQQYIEGRRCLYGGIFDHGKSLHWFSTRMVEAWPSPTGPAIRVRSHHDPMLTQCGERLFSAFQWDGIACAEFIQTPDGCYFFLEINPRPWASIYAAHLCGSPLLTNFAMYLLHKPLPANPPFINNKACTLFPAYISAAIASGSPLRARHIAYGIIALASAPWRKPALLRHFFRKLWWQYTAQRQSR